MAPAALLERLTLSDSCAFVNKQHYNSASWSRWWHSSLYSFNYLDIIMMAIGAQTRATFTQQLFTIYPFLWLFMVSTSFILPRVTCWHLSILYLNSAPSNLSSFWVFGKVLWRHYFKGRTAFSIKLLSYEWKWLWRNNNFLIYVCVLLYFIFGNTRCALGNPRKRWSDFIDRRSRWKNNNSGHSECRLSELFHLHRNAFCCHRSPLCISLSGMT